ncbi:2-hydroxyacid dehydrogenase [Telmatospirillum siberiense]|uniref:D-glycerate dehydrogenase n=1 Tax=Telmatospirillum siberiense TaxID=382514 RepID=A0A2N3PRU6_9PROT|nr:D-glycerate dehydrogenase [Telmatospirillum siberiense]PKU23121.1 D-glycerate dehydrogenase [Telmatospirillum siberiense]
MNAKPDKVGLLVARRMPDAVEERARREFNAVIAEDDMDVPAVLGLCRKLGNPAVIIGKKSGFSAADIAQLPETIRIIANPTAGYDHMDVEAAHARGIIVTNAPDALTECTADFSFMLILAACRRASEYDQIMRKGWRRSFGMPDMLGKRVNGQTLGIVGMGRIGRAVARRARGFNMPILYHNRTRLPPELEDGAEYVSDLADMLPRCDILSLHLPAGGKTLMTREAFNRLPRGAVFVNAARGSLVDEDALIEALESGHLFAAGLDVYRQEPNFDLRLAKLPNVFLAPHMGSATTDARNQMGFTALDNVAAVLAGRPPLDPV